MMDKFECYSILYGISKSKGIDVSQYIKELADSGIVSEGIISFIKSNTDSYTNINDVYSIIYEKRNNNPLYKSIVNESASIEDKEIALSSFVTQLSINMKNNGGRFNNIGIVTEAISSYLNGDSSKINEAHEYIRKGMKEFVKSRGDKQNA